MVSQQFHDFKLHFAVRHAKQNQGFHLVKTNPISVTNLSHDDMERLLLK